MKSNLLTPYFPAKMVEHPSFIVSNLFRIAPCLKKRQKPFGRLIFPSTRVAQPPPYFHITICFFLRRCSISAYHPKPQACLECPPPQPMKMGHCDPTYSFQDVDTQQGNVNAQKRWMHHSVCLSQAMIQSFRLQAGPLSILVIVYCSLIFTVCIHILTGHMIVSSLIYSKAFVKAESEEEVMRVQNYSQTHNPVMQKQFAKSLTGCSDTLYECLSVCCYSFVGIRNITIWCVSYTYEMIALHVINTSV